MSTTVVIAKNRYKYSKIGTSIIRYCLLLISIIATKAIAQPTVFPMPLQMKVNEGTFQLSKSSKILITDSSLLTAAKYFQQKVLIQTKILYPIVLDDVLAAQNNVESNILFTAGRVNTEVNGAYNIAIDNSQILLKADDSVGTFYGVQTLLQLLQPNITGESSFPQITITDYPQHPYRGMHLDVSRHFFTVSEVKNYLDKMAAYKFNVFHWHLTDDQGWRLEIKKYPLLTSVGAFRNGTITGAYPGTGNTNKKYGGFYTAADVKEIVEYAAERCIEVIPEIEMPGHSSAAIAAYPQLSCFPEEATFIAAKTPWAGDAKGKQVQQTWGIFTDVFAPTPYTFQLLEAVIDEVIALFPSKYIHIGGDECPKEAWKRSAYCQTLIAENNLKDEHGLQSFFIKRMERYINSKGKKIIGWDEILEGGLAPNATVMSWRGEKGGIAAAAQQHNVIMTPETPLYLNHAQSRYEDSVTQGGYNSLQMVYNYSVYPEQMIPENQKYVLGAQGNMWSEYISNEAKLNYQLYPRIVALSEALWSASEVKSWTSFEKKLPVLFARLETANIMHSKAWYDMQATISPAINNKGIYWNVSSNTKEYDILFSAPSVNSTTNNSFFISTKDTQTLKVTASQYKKNMSKNNNSPNSTPAIASLTQTFNINKATGKTISLQTGPSKSYPGNGAFTLVDGVQNTKGLQRATEFVGFNDTDLNATIDFGTATAFTSIKLHTRGVNGSWIYLPSTVQVYVSNFPFTSTTAAAPNAILKVTQQNGKAILNINGKFRGRYLKIIAKNLGTIPQGMQGSGNKAWLFADEIEVF